MEFSSSSRQLTVGLVAWHALPAICPRAGTSVGGLETGAWTLARGLNRYGSGEVGMAVAADRGPVPERVQGVRIWPHRDRWRDVRRAVADCISVGPPLRVKRLRPALLWQLPILLATRPWRPVAPQPMAPDPRLMSRNVDVWVGFGVNGDSARVAATAMAQGRPMLLFLESNADLDPRLAGDEEFLNAYGENSVEQRFVLQRATRIVCQSEWQQRRLKEDFQRDGVLIRNPIEIDQWRPATDAERDGVLWIGRYDDFHKRPHLAFEIARRCPNIPFRMIANRHDAEIETAIRQQRPANVELVDYVPFDQMPNQFASARVFLSTGNPEHEGFPNVLLQAAAAQTPIVSLHDFDAFLSRSAAGHACDGSVDQAVAHVQSIADSSSIDWDAVAHYLNRFHSLEQIATETIALIHEVLEQGGRGPNGIPCDGTAP